MKTFVRENTWLKAPGMDVGWGNGYVILPKGHKYHGVGYDSVPVEVHGGLTFGQEVTEDSLEGWEQLTKEDVGGWMIGFDTAHYGDTSAKWTKEQVQAETNRLLDQLKQLTLKSI